MDYISINDIETQVLEAMAKIDISPSNTSLAIDGKLHRYDVEGDKPKSRNGFYCIYSDGLPAGYFGSWKLGEPVKWRFDTGGLDINLKQKLSKIEESAEYKQKQTEREKALNDSQALAADHARVIFEQAGSADECHPYLVRKQVLSYGLRQIGDDLLIPLLDESGKFRSMQRINVNPDIPKHFEGGTSTKGAYFSIGGDLKEGTILICEGYATGATLHELTGYTVICAFSCHNLKDVAPKIKKKYPSRRIIVASDNDHDKKGNPGLTCAQEALKSAGLDGYIYPEGIKGTDWNDFCLERGPDETEKKIRQELQRVEGIYDDIFTKIESDSVPIEHIGGLFPRGDVSVFFGRAGCGKTIFLDYFTRQLSAGGKILDGIFHENEPERKVLFFEADAPKKLFATRKFFFAWGGNEENLKHIFSRELLRKKKTFLNLGDKTDLDFIRNVIMREKPDLVIFDTLQCFHSLDENTAKDMKGLFLDLVQLATDFDCAVVAVHHARKGNSKMKGERLTIEDSQGSNIFLRQAGAVISLEKMNTGEKEIFVFSRMKSWMLPTLADWFCFNFVQVDIYSKRLKMEFSLSPNVGSKKKDELQRLILSQSDWFGLKDIMEDSGCSAAHIQRIINELKNAGELETTGKGNQTKYKVSLARVE